MEQIIMTLVKYPHVQLIVHSLNRHVFELIYFLIFHANYTGCIHQKYANIKVNPYNGSNQRDISFHIHS